MEMFLFGLLPLCNDLVSQDIIVVFFSIKWTENIFEEI